MSSSSRGLVVRERFRPDPHPESVHYDDDVYDLLRDRPRDGRQVAGGGDQHSEHAQRHPPYSALESDPSQPAADVEQLVDLLERALENDGPRRLGGNLPTAAERDPDGRRRERGRIVDAVTDEERRRPLGFPPNELQLLLRGLARIDLVDADMVGEIAHFGLAVSGDEHDALETVPGA